MATVGQIYYNVVDRNTGGLITNCLSNGPSIFKDGTPGEIVTRYGANQFIKLGVQAPPGTRMVLNDIKTIMIGQTGMYELDDNVPITSLYFVRPRKYELKQDLTDAALQGGTDAMRAAEKKRENAMKKLGAEPSKSNIEGFKEYWRNYSQIQTVYIKEYNAGYTQFLSGTAGIYQIPNPNNIKAPENYNDLYNVIIDFIYE